MSKHPALRKLMLDALNNLNTAGSAAVVHTDCAVCKKSFVVTDDTRFYAKLNKDKTALDALEFYCTDDCDAFAKKAREDGKTG